LNRNGPGADFRASRSTSLAHPTFAFLGVVHFESSRHPPGRGSRGGRECPARQPVAGREAVGGKAVPTPAVE